MIATHRTKSDQVAVIPVRFRRTGRERGAAAVEMAIVMPLLVAMIIGIIDFSRIFNAEIQLSQAAREGVRLAALGFSISDVKNRAVLAAPSPAFGAPLPLTGVTVSTPCTAATPAATDIAAVRVTYQFKGILWMDGKWLTQEAVMRCAG